MGLDYSGLRALRVQRKVNLSELGKHLGVSRELMGKYERGDAVPRVDVFVTWCEYLGCGVSVTLFSTK